MSAKSDVTAQKNIVNFYKIPIGMVHGKALLSKIIRGTLAALSPCFVAPFKKPCIGEVQHNRFYYCGIEKNVKFDSRGFL